MRRIAHSNGKPKAERPLPADVEAEKRLLSCCANGCRPSTLPAITPESFTDQSNALLFSHFDRYYASHDVFDDHLFVEQIRAAGDFASVGGEAYLADILVIQKFVLAHLDHYAQIVADRAARRRLILAADDAYDTGRPLADVASIAVMPKLNGGSQRQTARQLCDQFPNLREPVIDGICRRGEVVNVIAASKVGKSWLAYGLAGCIATGRLWLDTFKCARGKVLLLDNELHPETLSSRLRTVGAAMNLDADALEAIEVVSLRGQSFDFKSLDRILGTVRPGEFQCVIADAFYRFLPERTDENSNSGIKDQYNAIDRYAEQLGATWINIHHESKGDQSGKKVTDVGAGAGSQSRAADTHLILRQHEEDGVSVIDAALRSFPPINPFSVRWNYPLWLREDAADPTRLKRSPTPQEAKRGAKDEADKAKIIAELAGGKTITASKVQKLVSTNPQRAWRLLNEMHEAGELSSEQGSVRGNETTVFSLTQVF